MRCIVHTRSLTLRHKRRLLRGRLGESIHTGDIMKAGLILGAAALCSSSFALGGCATTQEVLSASPTQVFHSTESPDKVAFCLGNKNNTGVLPGDNGAKVVLIKNGYGGVSMAFSIYPEGDGSRIEWRKKFGTIGGIWKQCVGLKEEK